MYDSGGLEILTEEESHGLLAGVNLGRIVFTERALPAIQPVIFALSQGDVIICTSAGSKLAAAARNAIVAFEVDHFDPSIHDGWSVVVIGQARVVSEAEEISCLRRLPLRSWTQDDRLYYIAITPKMISGRRIPRTASRAVPAEGNAES